MMERDSVALRAHLKGIIAASFVTLVLVALAAAFAIGFTGAWTEALADPGSALRIRTAALEALDENLGYDGFLKIYRSFLSTGDQAQGAELLVLVNEADANIARLLRAAATDSDRASAAALTRLEAPFRRAALFAAEPSDNARGAPPLAELDGDYAALRSRMSADAAMVYSARLNGLAHALVWAQATSIGALMLLSTVLLALAWFLRERLIGPLENLHRSVAAAAAGAISQPLWGIARKDEIGALARAADRLRQARLLQPNPILPELHTQVLERLAQGAMRLESDLAKMATATSHARQRIEQAGLRRRQSQPCCNRSGGSRSRWCSADGGANRSQDGFCATSIPRGHRRTCGRSGAAFTCYRPFGRWKFPGRRLREHQPAGAGRYRCSRRSGQSGRRPRSARKFCPRAPHNGRRSTCDAYLSAS